ncbi:MAG: ABC transporter ATP-binding protein [Planctomycetota bacterium JB042]
MGGVRIRGVERTVGGERHLEGVDLTIAAGRVTALLGPTRAGKSSLLRLVAGLDHPTRGDVRVEGSVAMVYQEFVNYPSLTVFENLASPLRVARVPRDEIDRRVRRIAARLRLDELLDRRPAALSGGQQQRVALGRALAKDADVVLLDEPLANLDLKLREELRAELRRLFVDGRRTVLLATTDPSEALSFGGDVVLLEEGRVVAHGPARELFDRPPDRRSAALFGDPPMQFLPLVRSGAGSRASLSLATGVPLPASALAAPSVASSIPPHGATLGVRPHHLSLEPRSPDAIRLDAEWEDSERLGDATRVRVRHRGLPLRLLLTGRAADADGPAGEVWLDPRRAVVFDADGRRIGPAEAAHGAD